ncbi:MAG: 50S ribosomal protein L11 methyltransferase [Candidatus Methylomirabilaceae bacterium]
MSLALSPVAADLVSSLLFESGATAIAVTEGPDWRLRTYLPSDGGLDGTLRRVRRYLASLGSLGLDPGPAKIATRRWRDPGWATQWRRFFRPVRIGRRLVIRPSWNASPARKEEIVVVLDPGIAFGTGQHATTRLCLELLDEAFEPLAIGSSRSAVKTRAQRSSLSRQPVVLDLGTGSGVLAIAALRFGAATVLALDTDSIACRAALENITRNGVDGRIVVAHGSMQAAGRRTFDLILANLTAAALAGLAPRLARSLRPGGRLIVSGVLPVQEARLTATFGRCGVRRERVRKRRGWVGLMFRRPTAGSRGSR